MSNRADLSKRILRWVDKAGSLSGVMYRSTEVKYANSADLISGEGSRQSGGRWNPPGLAAVYGSFTPQAAMEEALEHFRYYGLVVHFAMPRTFVAIEFALTSVLDLTDGSLRRSLGISERRLLGCDWRREMQACRIPITQELGQAVCLVGIEAMQVRSAADTGGRNLVVFVDNLHGDSSLSVIAADRLKVD